MNESLPTPPPLTEAQLAVNRAEQERLALKFKDSISAGNTRFARAKAVVDETESIFGEFVSLKKQRSLLTSIQTERYAKALASLGDFKTAAKFDDTKGYKEIDKAVWMPDDKTCHCKPIRSMGQDGETKTYPRQFVSQTIRSLKHGREVNLYACNECGFLNGRP